VIPSAADAIEEIVTKLSDFSALLPRLGELAMDTQKMNIEESRSPEGVPFRVLAPSTLAARGPAHPYGDKPLLDTTNMYQSIHYEVRGEDEVFAGPSLAQADYFPFVNQGHAGVPARSFIGLRPEDRDEIRNTVASWVMGQLE